MGKTLAVATPFIIAVLIFTHFLLFKAGKRAGRTQIPQRANQVGTKLLRDADQLFHELVVVRDLDTDDILTDRSKKQINEWRSNYEKARNL